MSFNTESTANGNVKLQDDASKPFHLPEALAKDYKGAIVALERVLKLARDNSVVAGDLQAKQQLLTELEQERAAKEEAEQGSYSVSVHQL